MYSSKDDKEAFPKVERNSQLFELVNVMLLNAKLPNNLWGEALLTACHIYNRVLSKNILIKCFSL